MELRGITSSVIITWRRFVVWNRFHSSRRFRRVSFCGATVITLYSFFSSSNQFIQEKQLLSYYERLDQGENCFFPSVASSDVEFIRVKLLAQRDCVTLDPFCQYMLGLCLKDIDLHQSLQCFVNCVKECLFLFIFM